MRLINIAYEHLEKERSNSPEDSFVRSSVTYEEAGIQKTFYVLYPAIFATRASEEGVWTADSPVDEVDRKRRNPSFVLHKYQPSHLH